MNVEGRSKIDEPVLQIQGPRISPFVIRNSLFDIRHSVLFFASFAIPGAPGFKIVFERTGQRTRRRRPVTIADDAVRREGIESAPKTPVTS